MTVNIRLGRNSNEPVWVELKDKVRDYNYMHTCETIKN